DRSEPGVGALVAAACVGGIAGQRKQRDGGGEAQTSPTEPAGGSDRYATHDALSPFTARSSASPAVRTPVLSKHAGRASHIFRADSDLAGTRFKTMSMGLPKS